MSDYIKLHELDNVGVLITPREGIPAGHKIALRDIAKGEKVIKYGCPIGTAQSREDWENLAIQADEALYEAKKSRRDFVIRGGEQESEGTGNRE